MTYLVLAAILGLVFVSWRGFNALVEAQALAAQERDALSAYHASQIAELCNRIQQPERASHVSISESAPPQEPRIDPDLAEELSILGELE